MAIHVEKKTIHVEKKRTSEVRVEEKRISLKSKRFTSVCGWAPKFFAHPSWPQRHHSSATEGGRESLYSQRKVCATTRARTALLQYHFGSIISLFKSLLPSLPVWVSICFSIKVHGWVSHIVYNVIVCVITVHYPIYNNLQILKISGLSNFSAGTCV